MPKLDSIKEVILMNLNSSRKELIPFKIVLDIYEHYYKTYGFPTFDVLINEYIPTATLFYSNLTDEDIKYMHDSIYNSRELNDILTNKLKAFNSKKRSPYIKYFDQLNHNYKYFTGGIDQKMFCI